MVHWLLALNAQRNSVALRCPVHRAARAAGGRVRYVSDTTCSGPGSGLLQLWAAYRRHDRGNCVRPTRAREGLRGGAAMLPARPRLITSSHGRRVLSQDKTGPSVGARFLPNAAPSPKTVDCLSSALAKTSAAMHGGTTAPASPKTAAHGCLRSGLLLQPSPNNAITPAGAVSSKKRWRFCALTRAICSLRGNSLLS
jgi:hypothetical protein